MVPKVGGTAPESDGKMEVGGGGGSDEKGAARGFKSTVWIVLKPLGYDLGDKGLAGRNASGATGS